ncbi:SMP-30/gluconolactonase/LRE family protein [Actinoplanes sp. NPDC049265]|uniref:SMP-30/gluconolactonase/LRE family protein n=1 Tax=Actinoplanes sp. NPDC049265 TaxID=3363902 RepID=UPI00371670BC
MVELVLEGIVLGESVRWHQGRVWFSDWVAGELIQVEGGSARVVARVDGMPFCFDWLPDGRMVSTNGTHQRLLAIAPDGEQTTHADLAGVVAPHAWNDIAVDPRGHVFVNNIGYDFPAGPPAPGLIAVITPGGAVRRVAGDLLFPNGMAVSPDGGTLVVAESHGERLTAFDITAEGNLTDRRVWAELPGDAPDGLCFDPEGAIWYASVPGRHCRRVREGGEILQTVTFEDGAFDCALSPDGTLYAVTADFSDPNAMFSGARTGRLLAATVKPD